MIILQTADDVDAECKKQKHRSKLNLKTDAKEYSSIVIY